MAEDAAPPAQLDPAALDPIVEALSLPDTDGIDRLRLWYQELLRDFWDYLKQLSGGEDGWLQRVSDWVTDRFRDVTTDSPLRAETVLDTIALLIALLLFAGVAYLAYRLWQQFKPLSPQRVQLPDVLSDPALQRPLAQLSQGQRATALFAQACRHLLRGDRLVLTPNMTNLAIAEQANLSADAKARLRSLARAADQALFAGWSPGEEEVAALSRSRDEVLASTPVHS